jgi:hypothetical protein
MLTRPHLLPMLESRLPRLSLFAMSMGLVGSICRGGGVTHGMLRGSYRPLNILQKEPSLSAAGIRSASPGLARVCPATSRKAHEDAVGVYQ